MIFLLQFKRYLYICIVNKELIKGESENLEKSRKNENPKAL